MSVLIPCPRCGRLVNPKARSCEHCGVDLAVAAVVAERLVATPGQVPAGVPIVPEILVPRIGDTMLEKGLIRPEQLEQALEYQVKQAAEGRAILLGEALLELGWIDREMLDQIITLQILQLQNALRDANHKLEARVQERTLELQQALERLSELNQLKSNFIANISHELRTPLTHIKGYLDIMAGGGLGPLTREQSDAVDVVQRAELRLEKLIEDLIQFSLASRGELSLNLEKVSLQRLIGAAVDRSMRKANAGQVSLRAVLPSAAAEVQVDEEKIGWVIFQLLDNALKFTPKGGRVEIKVAGENSLATIAVVDTGIGIPAGRIGEIFEPFHQLDSSPTRRYGGTGLGLAMAQRIVEAHGSKIHVDSVEGHGSRFAFSLPVISTINSVAQTVHHDA